MNSTRRATACVITCCLALSLAACGGGREYAIPKEACGVPLDARKLDPFLPDGKEFEEVGEPLGARDGTYPRGCDLRVDGSTVVFLHLYREEELVDPMGELVSHQFENREKIAHLPFGGLGAVGDRNALVSTRCAIPEAEYLVVDMDFTDKADGDVAERRRDIQGFALDFVPRLKKQLGCTK
ncbi:hypothetical protein [Streptomyces sudanensis]|uniref:hypothetical protein n=1 Tax=Streptomyces sudanensis TaxID=436397 RepID=UPI0020CF3CB2|nr:hypothetical protein [Streptomyces sudanensis]MCP9958045.1 hypothetical protein [Streptomyces sudanensis]MCQ0001430.1 hypothetical protein [Streptomyces sudanensis]